VYGLSAWPWWMENASDAATVALIPPCCRVEGTQVQPVRVDSREKLARPFAWRNVRVRGRPHVAASRGCVIGRFQRNPTSGCIFALARESIHTPRRSSIDGHAAGFRVMTLLRSPCTSASSNRVWGPCVTSVVLGIVTNALLVSIPRRGTLVSTHSLGIRRDVPRGAGGVAWSRAARAAAAPAGMALAGSPAGYGAMLSASWEGMRSWRSDRARR
jgi:hypothetical protein